MSSPTRRPLGWKNAALLGICSLVFNLQASEISPQVAAPVIPDAVASLPDFGAKGDGITLNTEAFAKAIDALSQKGGGKLMVPPGIWLTGPIHLRSNLELHLERGALVK